MENKEIKDVDLQQIYGGTDNDTKLGSHLSSQEVISMEKGRILIIENGFGLDLAKVEYLGVYRDPGTLYAYECKVKVLEIFNGEYIYDGVHYRYVYVGGETWVSRMDLDFIERA